MVNTHTNNHCTHTHTHTHTHTLHTHCTRTAHACTARICSRTCELIRTHPMRGCIQLRLAFYHASRLYSSIMAALRKGQAWGKSHAKKLDSPESPQRYLYLCALLHMNDISTVSPSVRIVTLLMITHTLSHNNTQEHS